MARSVEALIDEIDLLASRGLPRKEFFAELAPRVRTVVDNDASCWHTLDPHTRLLTSDDPAELIGRGIFTPEQAPGAGELIIRSEYMIDDVNTFAGLAAKRVPVGILDHATRGNPESSPRYRDLLLPSDIPHELRAAFVIRGRVWGAVHIARRGSSGPFQPKDADALAAITGGGRAWDPHVAALRRGSAHQWARGARPRRPRPRRRGGDDHPAGPRAARLDRRQRHPLHRRRHARRGALARRVRPQRAPRRPGQARTSSPCRPRTAG